MLIEDKEEINKLEGSGEDEEVLILSSEDTNKQIQADTVESVKENKNSRDVLWDTIFLQEFNDSDLHAH